MKIRRMGLAAAIVLLVSVPALATTYSGMVRIGGHWAAADSCLIELTPTATVAEVGAALAKLGRPLRQVNLPEGIEVLRADLQAVDVYTGEDIAIAVVDVDATRDLQRQMDAIAAVPGVKSVAPHWIFFTSMTPNDPLFALFQIDMRQTYVDTAWDLADGTGATVAVIDTGYLDTGLHDRARHVLQGYDFWGHDNDPNDYIGHGTHVTNTIAEDTNNGIGCAGIAYNATILPLKVFPDSDGGALESDILSAINYATQHGANVINMSLGGGDYYTPMATAIANAVAHNVVVVAAAGNDGTSTIEYPAAYPDCMAVGASNPHYPGGAPSLASFSDYGTGLSVVAPGVDITQETIGPYGGTGYEMYSGTSMASPHVAGTAALLVQYGGADAPGIRHAIESTAHNPANAWTAQLGYGEIDAHQALLAHLPTPMAKIVAMPTEGAAPLAVHFNGSASYERHGSIAGYRWRLQSGGEALSSASSFDYTFTSSGEYVVQLEVTGSGGATASTTVTITVTAPADDDAFNNDPCGNLLSTVYDFCSFELVLNNGQPVNGDMAQTMCENNEPAGVWACLEKCKSEVTDCPAFAQCAQQTCNVAVAHVTHHSSANTSHKSGCGI